MSAVDTLVRQARAGLIRLDPGAAEAAWRAGALLVDIRPEAQRCSEGDIHGALAVERNELEWRLDPTSAHRLAEVRDRWQIVILVCSEGYASSLAAASLQDVGLHHATDVVGGFRAWAAAGLPVEGGAARAQHLVALAQ